MASPICKRLSTSLQRAFGISAGAFERACVAVRALPACARDAARSGADTSGFASSRTPDALGVVDSTAGTENEAESVLAGAPLAPGSLFVTDAASPAVVRDGTAPVLVTPDADIAPVRAGSEAEGGGVKTAGADLLLPSCVCRGTMTNKAAATLKVTRAGLQMFPVEQIIGFSNGLRVEHWAFRDNRFEIVDKIFDIPRQVAEQGKRAQQSLMRELHIPEKRESRRVNSTQVKTKRKAV